MAAYALNAPVVIERAEGRELIGVGGRRYRAIVDRVKGHWLILWRGRKGDLHDALMFPNKNVEGIPTHPSFAGSLPRPTIGPPSLPARDNPGRASSGSLLKSWTSFGQV